MKKLAESRTFSENDLDSFINLSNDRALFHSSKEHAKSSGFENRICHGVMTLMPVSKILGEIIPGEGYVILEISAKFNKPIYPGNKINYYAELKSENKELGFASVNIIWENEFNQKLGSTTAICKKII